MSFSQSIDQVNLEKYWQYRDRFRQKFSKIGAEQGESITIKAWQYQSNQTALDGNWDPQFMADGNLQNGNAIRTWDDIIEHGYYSMVLATEYELLSRMCAGL